MPTEAEIRALLLSMPLDGWMEGNGPHQETLMALLDEDSMLVEEIAMPECDDTPAPDWLVRLTPIGAAVASAIQSKAAK